MSDNSCIKLALDGRKRPRSCMSNVAEILRNHPDWKNTLAFDVFSMRTIVREGCPIGSSGVWSDLDCTKTIIWMFDNYEFNLSELVVTRAVDLVANENSFHPVVDYVNSLEWDGVPRVDTWLEKYFGAPKHPATTIFQPTALIGAISRVMSPGSKNDYVLVLEGKQGIGKSSGICALFGHDWFSDAPLDFGNKMTDSYLAMRGKWCIEIAELDRLKSANMSKVKAFFSQITDAYRPPYGRNVIDVPRQCVFIGTVNSNAYLSDSTGNRRFMPVKTTQVDVDGLVNNRDQIWAEANFLYWQHIDKGTNWWFSNDNPDILFTQESRYESDPWEDTIGDYIQTLPDTVESIHSEELFTVLDIEVKYLRRSDFSRIRDAMSKLGWTVGRPYVNGVQKRGFTKHVDPNQSFF